MAVIHGEDSNNIVGKVITPKIGPELRLGTASILQGGISGARGPWHWEKWSPIGTIGTSVFSDVYTLDTVNSVFFGCIFKVDSTTMQLQIEVDSNIVLDLHLKDDLSTNFALDFGGMDSFSCPWILEYSNRRYRFVPPEPTKISSSFKVKLKSTSGENKNLEAGLSVWREE